MNFLKNLFGKKEESVNNYSDFWNWFVLNEKQFFDIVKDGKNIEKQFFNKLSAKLGELKEGFFYLTGMYDDETVELILTADGNIKNIVFVEELVTVAPNIAGWKFTALKPSIEKSNYGINMHGYDFSSENIYFYSNDLPNYPDEVDLVFVYDSLDESNKNEIETGVYIFLDNYLGELDFVKNIDGFNVVSKSKAEKELISIAKLKDYLKWRSKEFIEKYDGMRYDTEKDEYTLYELKLNNGNMLLATINVSLLNWDSKASHPWIGTFTLKYDGKSTNGMPTQQDSDLFYNIEDELMESLIDKEGYLNIGRETGDGERVIYFACNDFRKPSKVFFESAKKHSSSFEIEYDIYKDKYWQSLKMYGGE